MGQVVTRIWGGKRNDGLWHAITAVFSARIDKAVRAAGADNAAFDVDVADAVTAVVAAAVAAAIAAAATVAFAAPGRRRRQRCGC